MVERSVLTFHAEVQESLVMAWHKQIVVSSESLLLLAFVLLCGWVAVSWILSLSR